MVPMNATQTPTTTDARLVHDGWDGRSRSVYVLRSECGCKRTADGKALLSVCAACLTAAR